MARLGTLKGAAMLFIATWIVHTADHIRRGTESTSDGVVWSGTFAAVVAAIALTLIFTDHALAPFVSAVVFGAIALGVAATHLAPDWGYFSEPLLVDSATDRWAAVAAIPEIMAAGLLAWVGFTRTNTTVTHPRTDSGNEARRGPADTYSGWPADSPSGS